LIGIILYEKMYIYVIMWSIKKWTYTICTSVRL